MIMDMSFEEALKELEGMAEKIKSADTSLEETIKCYEEGMRCYEKCREILESAEQKIQVFSR